VSTPKSPGLKTTCERSNGQKGKKENAKSMEIEATRKDEDKVSLEKGLARLSLFLNEFSTLEI